MRNEEMTDDEGVLDPRAEQREAALRFLRTVADGELLEQLDADVRDLVAKIKATGRKGQVALTITVEPADQQDTSCLRVSYEMKSKTPRPGTRASFMYPHVDNRLGRDVEGQMRLDLRVVAAHRDETARSVRPVE